MKYYFKRSSLRSAFLFWGISVAGFYLLPLCVQDTGTAMFVLLVVLPVLCFGCAWIYAVRHAPALWYVTGVPLLFVPSVFLFYGSDLEMLAFYAIGYMLVAAVGHIVGIGFRKMRP